MSARYAREVANRPAAERLTDAQVKRIRRRRQAGELLYALAAEHRVSTRTLRRRLNSADASAATAKEQKAAGVKPKQAGRQPQKTTAVTQTNRPQPPPQPQAAASLLPRLEPEPDQLEEKPMTRIYSVNGGPRSYGGRQPQSTIIGHGSRAHLYPDSVPGRAVGEERYALVRAEGGEVASAPSLADAERVRSLHEQRHGPLELRPAARKGNAR